MFQGRQYDNWGPQPWYYFRNRFYDPTHGRFVARDPLGMWGDPGQMGNAYALAVENAVNGVDPWGLFTLAFRWQNAQSGTDFDAEFERFKKDFESAIAAGNLKAALAIKYNTEEQLEMALRWAAQRIRQLERETPGAYHFVTFQYHNADPKDTERGRRQIEAVLRRLRATDKESLFWQIKWRGVLLQACGSVANTSLIELALSLFGGKTWTAVYTTSHDVTLTWNLFGTHRAGLELGQSVEIRRYYLMRVRYRLSPTAPTIRILWVAYLNLGKWECLDIRTGWIYEIDEQGTPGKPLRRISFGASGPSAPQDPDPSGKR